MPTSTSNHRRGGDRRGLRWLVLLAVLYLVWCPAAFAQASVQSGPWSNPATWGGSPPISGTVNIDHAVECDTITGAVNPVVRSGGTLKLSRTSSCQLNVDLQVVAQGGGTLDFGTLEDPIPPQITHDIRFKLTQAEVVAAASEPGYSPALYSPTIPGVWALPGSTWKTHGAPLTRTWGKLAADVAPGALDVSIAGDATDWPIGGEVAVSQTVSGVTYNPSGSVTTTFELEYGTIASIGAYADGVTTITLAQPLVYGRSGTGDFRGDVALITRNVKFITDLDAMGDVHDVRNRKFACTRFMPGGDGSAITHTGGAQGYLAYAQFERMGFYLKDGCFPIHIHRMGDDARDMFVRGISCKQTGFRCLNLHESNGFLTEDAVSLEAGNGASFFVQNDKTLPDLTSQQQDSVFVHNFCGSPQAKHFEHRSGAFPGERGRSAACFWPGASDHEAHLGNVAAGPARDGSETTGFHWPEWVVSDQGSINRVFIANEAHSIRGDGLHSWQNRGARAHDIVASKTWGNIEGFVHGAYGFNLQTFNAKFHDNQTGIAQGVISGFVQDSSFTGRLSSTLVPLQDAGIRFGGYNIQPHPSMPNRYVRNTFTDMRASATGTSGAAVWRNGVDCADTETETSWSERFCASAFVIMAENTYGAGVKAKNVGWLEGPSPKIPNINSYWLDHERQLVLLRKDVDGTAGQFTPSLLNAQTFYDADSDAKATPYASLPGSITFTGLTNYRDRPYSDFTLDLGYDSPPLGALDTSLSGMNLTMIPTNVSADTVRMECWVEWVKTCDQTMIEPVMVDLEQLALYGDILPPRKYHYAYLKFFDGVTINAGCGAGVGNCWPGTPQRAYSNVVEIGPELNFSEDQSAYISQLEATIAAKDAEIADLQTQLSSKTAEIALLDAAIATERDARLVLEAQVASIQAQMASLQTQVNALQAEKAAKDAAMAGAIDLLELPTPDVAGAIDLLDGEPPTMPNPSIVATVKTSGIVNGATGISLTHGLSLQNGDILAAFVGHADDASNFASTSGGTWENTVSQVSATDTDRGGAWLYRVVTDAGSEPSAYVFTFTAVGSDNTGVILHQIRDGDTSAVLDGTSTGSNGVDDFTPDQVDITTATDGALVLVAHLAVDLDGTLGSKTAGAPSAYTIVDSQAVTGGTGAELFMEVASANPTLGAQAIGAWTGSADDATAEYITLAMAIKPGSGGQAAATTPTQSFTMMGIQ